VISDFLLEGARNLFLKMRWLSFERPTIKPWNGHAIRKEPRKIFYEEKKHVEDDNEPPEYANSKRKVICCRSCSASH